MRVTVLGKSPSWQDAGGACSGYLVQEDGYTLVLDCGSGAFGKLRASCDYAEVDAVLITHMHSDHFMDLIPFSNALRYGPRRLPRPRLHLPPGGAEVLRRAAEPGGAAGLVDAAFEADEYDPGAALELGPLRAELCPVPHYISTHAVRLDAADARFTFSADTAPSDDLVRFARDSDLLLIEATLEEPETVGGRGHLTAAEAGEHGRRAGARRLVLTHWSDERDVELLRAQAGAAFGADVELAAEGVAYSV